MTYEELKLITMQKCKVTEGSTIPDDETTQDYLAQLPFVANEALQMLATAGKYVRRTDKITQSFVANLLPDEEAYKINTFESGSIEYKAEKGHSYIFDYTGKGTLNVYVANVLVSTVSLENKQGYATTKALVTNPLNAELKLVISSDYPFTVRNVGLYSATWETADEIDPCKRYVRYNMRDRNSDFFQLDSNEIYYEGEETAYLRTSDYFQEGDTVLVLERSMSGDFTIYYRAYPGVLDLDTDDDYVIDVDSEVAALIPLYAASQILKGDEDSLATVYRNEFEVGISRLSLSTGAATAEEFASESGW